MGEVARQALRDYELLGPGDVPTALDWRRRDERFNEPLLSDHLATAERVRSVADRLGVAPGAVAIAWTLRNPAVDGAIVGLRRPNQVDELIDAATLELSDEDAGEIEGRR